MLHQREEERHVTRRHALLVERQDVMPGAGVDQEIGILDALGDALVGQQFAQVVAGEKPAQLFGGNVGVNGHGAEYRLSAFRATAGAPAISAAGWATC